MTTTTNHGNGVTVTTSGGRVSVGIVGDGAPSAVVGSPPTIPLAPLPVLKPNATINLDLNTNRGSMAMQISHYGAGSDQLLDVSLVSADRRDSCPISNNPQLAAEALQAARDLASRNATIRAQGTDTLNQTVIPAIMNACAKPRER